MTKVLGKPSGAWQTMQMNDCPDSERIVVP